MYLIVRLLNKLDLPTPKIQELPKTLNSEYE